MTPPTAALPAATLTALRQLADRWADATPAERANYALYLVELCDALGVTTGENDDLLLRRAYGIHMT